MVRDSDPDAPDRTLFDREIGSCWLMSAKLARDDGLVQAAYVIPFVSFATSCSWPCVYTDVE